MSSYHHFTTKERESLLILIKTGKKNCEIAKILGRSESSISREIRRNCEKREEYSAVEAAANYVSRRKRSVRPYLLALPGVADRVSHLLSLTWSPEQISSRLRLEDSECSLCPKTIYRGLENGLLPANLCKVLRYKSKQHHGGRGKSRCGHLDIEYSIHDRPKCVEDRNRLGDWEGDTVRGYKNSGCVGTQVDRMSRYAILFKLPDRTAAAYTAAMIEQFKKIPESKRCTFTVDHGKEFANHREIHEKLGGKVYFADPHAPWQRGTNENFNGLLRQFLPKHTSFDNLTQEHLEHFATLLNRRPRKCLGWKCPEEVFFHYFLHLT